MRIIVMSDSHGRTNSIRNVLSMHPEARACIFLGDGERDFDSASAEFDGIDFYAVAGNCDLAGQNPPSLLIELGGKRIFASHGHNQYVKYGIERLVTAATACGADIALFGHTHQSMTQYIDGLYLMNPGSIGGVHVSKKTYGLIDIERGGVLMNIGEI